MNPIRGFKNRIIELHIYNAQDVGRNLEPTVEQNDDSLSPQMSHEPAKFHDYVLACTPMGLRASYSDRSIIRCHENESERAGTRIVLELLDDRHSAIVLVPQYNWV